MGVQWWGVPVSGRKPSRKPAPPSAAERMVAALLVERHGYMVRGRDDRVAQVDEQLAFYGHRSKNGDKR